MELFFRGVVFTSTGLLASLLSQFFGGFDMLLQTLVLFMAVDLISGLISAAVFKKISSRAGIKGLFKKGSCLLLIVVAVHLDALLGTNSLTRDAVIIAFCLNELISILENMGKIGIKMPAPIIDALEILSKKKA
ncbi:MAG: phage holin family protein [Defluviitaleaceae bacterium]|nr:phage holin family protein [Defluviitaleaceae bacterium]